MEDIKVSRFNHRLVGLVTGRPVLSLLLAFLLVGALIPGLGRLRADFTHRGFFWEHDPLLKAFDAFERRFGNDDAVVVAVHSPSGVFDMDSATLLRELTDEMWKLPEIIRVDSLANFNWVHAKDDDIVIEPLFPPELTPEILANRKEIALHHDTLPGYLVSTDGKTALVLARVKPGIDRPPNAQLITTEARKLVASKQGRGDNQIVLAGGPPMTFAFQEATQQDISKLIPVALLIAAVFLLISTRSIAGMLLPFPILILSAMGSFGFAGWTGLVQTAMTTVVPTTLIAVSIADAVHILVNFFQAMGRGLDRKAAARFSLSKNLLPTFLTSLTTAVGFLSFSTANLKPLATLGFMLGFGAMLAWVLTYLFLGPMLILLPIRQRASGAEKVQAHSRRAERMTDFLVRRRRGIVAATGVFAVLALAASLQLDINSDPVKYFKRGVPMRDANEFIDKEVGGARAFELVAHAGKEDGIKEPDFLRKVDQLQDWVEEHHDVSRAVSIVDILKSMNKSLHGDEQAEYKIADTHDAIAQELLLYTMGLPAGMDINDRVSVKNDDLRITVMTRIPTSREAVAFVDATIAKAKSLGLNLSATGKFYLYQLTNSYVVSSFIVSLIAAIIAISLIMIISLRSVKLGLFSMLPNFVPLLAGGGLMFLLGRDLDMGAAIVAAISLGIAVDDTIHVLANYRRLRDQGLDARGAVRDLLEHTAPPLINTTAILVLAFGSFAMASFVPNILFGVTTAFVLGVALIVDLTFTPALLMLIGRDKSVSSAGAGVTSDAAA